MGGVVWCGGVGLKWLNGMDGDEVGGVGWCGVWWGHVGLSGVEWCVQALSLIHVHFMFCRGRRITTCANANCPYFSHLRPVT